MAEEREGNLISPSEQSKFISCLSGNDAVILLEIIHKSISCKAEKDFIDLFPKIKELFSYDFAVALVGNIESNRFVTVGSADISLPNKFSHEYVSKDYIQTDALVREFARTQTMQPWPDGWEKLGQRKKIISLCVDTNMKKGIIHGSKPNALTKKGSLFCFYGPKMLNDRRTVYFIDLLIPHLHLSLTQIFNKLPSDEKVIILSNRETEVLNWLKQGKSSWDVSVILGISERTVNYHIYNIMQKLDVVNRPQALAVAARLGLIDVE